MSFEQLGLNQQLIRALADRGYTSPTPIQQLAIPPVLAGNDVMASAPTGTGKTAAFTLPILQNMKPGKGQRAPRALILTPTRELAAQVLANIETYGKHQKIKAIAVFGGVKINPQISLLRQGVDIVVATPGRLLDLRSQNEIDLQSIETFVLDEADRMLDMGFIRDIRRIQKELPAKLQCLQFSATFSKEIRELASSMLTNPVMVDTAPVNSTATTVEQCVITVDKPNKPEAMKHIIEQSNGAQILVFSRTKHGADKLVRVLRKSDIEAAAIHGNKSQGHRNRVLSAFKQGNLGILIATDIASRGLDIKELPMVLNYDLPDVPEDYVHRIGRTGRAGADGLAFSLVSVEEVKQLHAIEKVIGEQIPRDEIEGLEAENVIPIRQAGGGRGNNRGSNNRGSNNRSKNNRGNNARGSQGGRQSQRSGNNEDSDQGSENSGDGRRHRRSRRSRGRQQRTA